MVKGEASVMKAGQEQIRSVAHASKAAVELRLDLSHRARRPVSEMLLDVAMTVLFGVQLRRIAGQELHHGFRMFGQIGLHTFRTMRTRAIPDEHKRLADPAPHVFQAQQQLLRIDAAAEVPLVHFAGNRQRCHGRDFAPVVFNPFEHGRLPARRPGRRHLFSKGEAEFVLKHDLGAVPPRFFLYSSNPGSARRGSGLRRAPAPVFRVSGRSNPVVASAG